MSLIQRMCKQTCVYWAPGQPDIYNQITYAAPVQLGCRWDEVAELFIDRQGKQVVSSAIVYLLQDVALDGYLMQGCLDDIAGPLPSDNPTAYVIRSFSKIRKLRKAEFLRMAKL